MWRIDKKFVRKEMQGVAQASNTANSAMRNTAAASKQLGQGSSRNASLFQNMSYQVTDFAVQTQGGVTAMRAFSQQAPQMAGALGAAGIGGAAGMAAFAIASVASALAPAIIAFFDLGSAATVAKRKLGELSKVKIDISGFLADTNNTNHDNEGPLTWDRSGRSLDRPATSAIDSHGHCHSK